METIDETKSTTVKEEAEFEYDWLTRDKYQFKILALIAVLANNNLAYRGTLADMCAFFGVASGNYGTNQKLKAAIAALETDGLLKQIVDGRTYTLTLSKKAEKKQRVIRIQKEWVGYATNYKNQADKSESVDWSVILKVWLYLISRGNTNAITTDQKISEELGIAKGTVTNARNALKKDIRAIICKKRYSFDPKQYQPYRCLGSEITVKAWFADDREES